MSSSARMTEATIAALCDILCKSFDAQYGAPRDSPAWQQKLPRLLALSGFVVSQLVPLLPVPGESAWRLRPDDNHGNGPYHIVYEFVTSDGASFQLRKFAEDKGLGYTFSPAPLMNHAEMYYNPEGWFFYTKNQRVGETFKAQGVVPLYDFGLPAPVQQTKEQAKDESVNDSTRG